MKERLSNNVASKTKLVSCCSQLAKPGACSAETDEMTAVCFSVRGHTQTHTHLHALAQPCAPCDPLGVEELTFTQWLTETITRLLSGIVGLLSQQGDLGAHPYLLSVKVWETH